MRRLIPALVAALAAAPLVAPLAAQGAGSAATLTLEEAISIAKRNNPQYLQAVNARQRAGGALRAAYGALLPGANAEAMPVKSKNAIWLVASPIVRGNDNIRTRRTSNLQTRTRRGAILKEISEGI